MKSAKVSHVCQELRGVSDLQYGAKNNGLNIDVERLKFRCNETSLAALI